MKGFSWCFCMALFCVANAFAADSSISRVIPTKISNENVEQKSEAPVKNRVARDTDQRVSRTVSRTTQINKNQTQKSTNVVSRSTNTVRRGTQNHATTNDTANISEHNNRVNAGGINANPAVRRAGVVLRASTAEFGGRATIGNTGIQTGSNIDEQIRGVKSRAVSINNSKQKEITAESLAAAKDIMEKTSDLNNVCQQQYNECMDQFCAVVDANQKRCSCSANLTKYANAQKAVENANTELNDVAQRIRYVGLSADEIRAIMSETEAETVMSKTKDTTQTRSLLDDIADMIKDPTSSITTNSGNSDSLLDMELDFSSDSSDLFSLDMFNNSNNISSKRGTALYNEAKKRCKSVLNRCKDAGGTENQIVANYDLAIDKDCITYEQGLNKLNQTLVNNVRSANLMLQKARLAVLQNKNEYDIKGCVGALEKCMLDDMVCGEDYIKCLDPTKKYIDENGNVVLGRNIANITDFMTDYNNSGINTEFIKSSSNDTTCEKHDGACIVNYLMTKIGTGATVKEGGLCRAVLDKCQIYTYNQTTKTPTYNPYNDVVVNYIQRAMVNIKAAQSRIIANYASNCMNDIADCYNQQNSQITSWSSYANVDNVYSVMKGACYNVALTCGYAVFAYDSEMAKKLSKITCEKYGCEGNKQTGKCETQQCDALVESGRQSALIDGVSEIFNQSLLCPDNSDFVGKEGNVNTMCSCRSGYLVYKPTNSCVSSCPSSYYVSSDNTECVLTCNANKNEVVQDGKCVDSCSNGYLKNAQTGTCVSACSGKVPYKNKEGTECVATCGDDVIQDGQCANACNNGYTPNETTKVCEKTPSTAGQGS